jgi:hypothetical protein
MHCFISSYYNCLLELFAILVSLVVSNVINYRRITVCVWCEVVQSCKQYRFSIGDDDKAVLQYLSVHSYTRRGDIRISFQRKELSSQCTDHRAPTTLAGAGFPSLFEFVGKDSEMEPRHSGIEFSCISRNNSTFQFF